MIVHCLFEQSGTFKNEFKKLGIEAYDYDILNDFGQTDFQIDLFKEIDVAYNGGGSIFDNIKQDDIIMSFFPCITFSVRFGLNSRCKNIAMKNWSLEDMIEYSTNLQNKRFLFYQTLNRFIIVCLRKKLKVIIENPYHTLHFLTQFAPYSPAFIDHNRNLHGDDFKKPTQFFFFNCSPKFNFVEPIKKKGL